MRAPAKPSLAFAGLGPSAGTPRVHATGHGSHPAIRMTAPAKPSLAFAGLGPSAGTPKVTATPIGGMP
jgi:hypothetical protein